MTKLTMADSPILVQGTGVSKSYLAGSRKIKVLEQADFAFARSSFTAIIGRSGTGKTTLLNLCAGIDQPDSGHINFAGRQLEQLSAVERAAFRNEKIGFIFQSFFLREGKSTLDNVMAPLLLGNRTVAECRERARQALVEVGLEDYIRTPAGQLSGGQKQRVAIARAVANHPELILADEPTGSLDTQTSREILDLLLRYNQQQGATIIVVTHDPLVEAYGIPMVTVRNGKVEPVEAASVSQV